jgi:Zn-finger nucleic acid-binding protein
MNCSACGAPMRLLEGRDSFVCDYCKQVSVPPENEEGVRVLGEASALACPVCSLPLLQASMAHYRILYCTHCHGSLLGMAEFTALVADLRAEAHGAAAIPHAPAPEELQRRLNCPQCHRTMDTHYYAGPGNIVIDDCSRCELNWLDAGELRTIAHAPDHSYGTTSESISDYDSGFEGV